MNLINLKNKKVFITGGTAGIGLSILESFYKLEADIFTIGTNVENLKTIQSNFPKIKTSNFNLENHQKIEELVKEAKEKLGGLDIVINNAGVTKDNLAIRMSDEEWNKVININLTAVFLICKYSIKVMMKQDSGSIINISSIVGHTGNFGQANYSSAKAGIVAMSLPVPNFPIGIFSISFFLNSSLIFLVIFVSINPGDIQFTLIFFFAYSFARLFDIATIPALALE